MVKDRGIQNNFMLNTIKKLPGQSQFRPEKQAIEQGRRRPKNQGSVKFLFDKFSIRDSGNSFLLNFPIRDSGNFVLFKYV